MSGGSSGAAEIFFCDRPHMVVIYGLVAFVLQNRLRLWLCCYVVECQCFGKVDAVNKQRRGSLHYESALKCLQLSISQRTLEDY